VNISCGCLPNPFRARRVRLLRIFGKEGGVYQRHEYREERKRALLAWSRRVAQIVEPGGPKQPHH